MDEPDEVVRYVIGVLDRLDIAYAVGGSWASIVYGEPRATMDLDVVADLRERDLPALLSSFPPGEFYLSEEAVRDAIRFREEFNVIHPASGFKIDFFVPATEMERGQLSRTRRFELVPGCSAEVSPPEELILKKLDYHRIGGSDKHLRDIGSMLRISGDDIDAERVTREAERLGLSELWEAVLRRVEDADR